MTRISIVEDNQKDSQKLKDLLDQFQKDNSIFQFEIHAFPDAISFFKDYKPVDIVFMDIELPYENGMEASHKLREIDKDVMIIFVTNMEQFAVDGYQVNAFDFIVKPLTYYNFSLKLDRALKNLSYSSIGKSILIKIPGKVVKIPLKELKYVEINDYVLTYHTIESTYEVTTTNLQETESALEGSGFFKCSRQCIVNMKFVNSVSDKEINLSGETIPIARRRKKAFIDSFMSFMGKGDLTSQQ